MEDGNISLPSRCFDWNKPWRKAIGGNPESVAGPSSHRRWELTGKQLRWNWWWTDLELFPHARQLSPKRPGRTRSRSQGSTGQTVEAVAKQKVACWMVQHAVCWAIALRFDLRGLFPDCPLGQLGPPSLPPRMGPASGSATNLAAEAPPGHTEDIFFHRLHKAGSEKQMVQCNPREHWASSMSSGPQLRLLRRVPWHNEQKKTAADIKSQTHI